MCVHIFMPTQETKRVIKMLNLTAFFVTKQTVSEELNERVNANHHPLIIISIGKHQMTKSKDLYLCLLLFF